MMTIPLISYKLLMRPNAFCKFPASRVSSASSTSTAFDAFQITASFDSILGHQYVKRSYSTEKIDETYAKTMNLPQTDFPMRADAMLREHKFARPDVYAWQLNHNSKAKPFVLHDGPPYANGSPHMGHVLNKVLKDIVNRYKIMQGYHVNYINGWDCHGLPIEMKVLEKMSASERSNLTPLELRAKAKEYALGQIRVQMNEFKKWGVLGEYEHAYKTMDPEYEAAQIGVFGTMVRKGLIYRDVKPIFWSPSSKTALAEAELEYNNEHISTAAYILFKVTTMPSNHSELLQYFNKHLKGDKKVNLAIWTTTPWTIPANLAISVGPNIQYSLVEDSTSGSVFIMATDLIEAMQATTSKKFKVLLSGISGSQLSGAVCEHPLNSSRSSLVITAQHVTTESGTGLVHTAPGHGQDDFYTCKLYGIPPFCPVDDNGKFTAEAGPEFEGKFVLKEGNEAVLLKLERSPGALLFKHKYSHKYPYDWRTKQPIIIRATKQWFADLRNISQPSVLSLESVQSIPAAGKKRLESMIGTRQDWCISRQRQWGVPIPVLYDVETDEPLLTDESIEFIRSKIANLGTDCWWQLPVEELLAPEYRQNGKRYKKGMDTMDVWFDSGTSWAGVVQTRGLPLPADMYLEGSDQHRGWFQSSLLTSVAVNNEPPYKVLLTHGFVLDEKLQKMSKSLGNVIEPSYVINGGKDKTKSPAYGVDVMRMWVASTDYSDDVTISDSVLAAVSTSMKKLRNTARFMLGNLNDFNPDTDEVHLKELMPVDRYMLHRVARLVNDVTKSYEAYQFSTALREIHSFASADVSSFYLSVLKDRLYADIPTSHGRRSAQTVLRHILEIFTTLLSPIICHTSEEIYSFMPWKHSNLSEIPRSVYFDGWPHIPADWEDNQIQSDWSQILAVRSYAFYKIEDLRSSGAVNTSSSVDLTVQCMEDHPIRKLSPSELSELFIVGHVTLENYSKPLTETKSDHGVEHLHVTANQAREHKCPRCWRFVSPKPNVLCVRCHTCVDHNRASVL